MQEPTSSIPSQTESANKQDKSESITNSRFGTTHELLLACNQNLLSETNDLAQSYVMRSHFLLDMYFYDNSMNSIKLAELSSPSKDTELFIQAMRKDYANLTKVQKEDLSENPHANKFTLFYPANPKLPFFIDALDVRHDMIFGNILVTKEKLKAGDVIAEIHDPIVTISEEMRARLCYQCMRNNNFDLQTHEKFKGSKS